MPGNGLTLSGPAAVTYNGNEYLFARGLDDRVYVNRFDGTNWTGWGPVPGDLFTTSAPAAAIYFGLLHLVLRGTDNRIYWARFDGSTWTSLGEVCCGGTTIDAPAVTSFVGGLVVVVRGGDNATYQNRYDKFAGTWSGWTVVPGGGTTVSAPAATVFNNGQVDVLELAVRGVDDRVYQNQFNPFANTWSGWGEIPGDGFTPSGPDAAVFGDGLYIAVRGTDDQLYMNRFDGANWTGWALSSVATSTLDDPALGVFNDSLTVFTRAADNRLFSSLTSGTVPVGFDQAPASAGVGADRAGAATAGAAAATGFINCPRKSSNPVGSGILIGSGSTTCNYVGGGPAAMNLLTVNVALYEADFPGGSWRLVDHQYLPNFGQDAILETVSKVCTGRVKLKYFVVVTDHEMVPPIGYYPIYKKRRTMSERVLRVC